MNEFVNQIPRRFTGVAKIYGETAYQRFAGAHITIIGVGGVGSWVIEALARSGIGKLCLIDEDVVAESNINRQLAALDSTLGANKIDVLKARALDINPGVAVECKDTFLTIDNIDQLIQTKTDYVIDCIDNSRVKAALIAWCKRNKVPVITLGGAGGKSQPEHIQIADLSRSIQDPLLSKTRKRLRQDYGFSSNPKRRFSVPAVFSTEAQKIVDGDSKAQQGSLSCAGGLGSAVVVTAAFGFYAVGYVLNKLSATQ